MKLALVAIVLALGLVNVADAYYYGGWGGWGMGYGYGWPYYGGFWGKRDNPPSIDRTECIYNKETSMLMCHGKSDKHECEAEMKLPKEVNYELYGIGILEETPDKHFHLIPRKLDNSGWIKPLVVDEADKTTQKSISMYQSDKFEDYGLKVKDAECFGQIVKLLGLSKRHEKIFIESESTEVIAGLSVMEKSPEKQEGKSKRFWGMGMWGYPMWGFGLWGKRDAGESMPVSLESMPVRSLVKDIKRDVEAGFEVRDDSHHVLAREVEKLKRDVKNLKMMHEE